MERAVRDTDQILIFDEGCLVDADARHPELASGSSASVALSAVHAHA